MKKKITISVLSVLAILSVLSVTAIGCMTPNTATTDQTTTTTPIGELQTWRTNIDTWKTTVADPAIAKVSTLNASTVSQSQIDSINTKLATMQAQVTALSAKVDSQAEDIESLQNELEDITTNTVVSGNTAGTTGNIKQFEIGSVPTIVTSADGGIISQVNFTSGGNELYSSQANSAQVYYVQRIINQNNAKTLYVTPIIGLNYDNYYGGYSYTSQNITNISVLLSSPTYIGYTGSASTATYSATNATQNYIMNGAGNIASYYIQPPLGANSYAVKITPTFSYYKGIPIAAGQYIDITVQLSNLYSNPGGIWKVNPTVEYTQ